MPVYNVTIPGVPGHEMNAILTGNCNITGDDATKWENWNFIEPQFDQMNIQPGQAYMPMNCEIIINYTYVLNSPSQGKILDGIPILTFKIKNGIPNLIWENNDPNLN